MKTKRFIIAFSAVAAWALVSCGGGGTTSSGVSKKSLFGDIPQLYEDKIADFVKEIPDPKEDAGVSEAFEVLAKMQQALDEAAEEAKPLADKMVGEKLAYELSDSLPYQIVSDIEVKKVRLPGYEFFGGGGQPTRLDVEFDIVLTQPVDGSVGWLYYWIMDDDTPIGYGDATESGTHEAGDTVHISERIEAPDAPAKYVKGCNMLKFVTRYAYFSRRSALIEQAEKWNDELLKKLGLKKED